MSAALTSLRNALSEANGMGYPTDDALRAAGSVIAHYVRQTAGISDNVMVADILETDHSYPRVLFDVPMAHIDTVLDALHGIDIPSPTWPGLHFPELVCCDPDDETCRIVINAGAPLVHEFAMVLSQRMIDDAIGPKAQPVAVVAAPGMDAKLA